MFFRFPPDARWNPDRNAVEFGIGVGEYEGVVRVSRRVSQILLPEAPTPERCLECYRVNRTRLNSLPSVRFVAANRPMMATSRSRDAICRSRKSGRIAALAIAEPIHESQATSGSGCRAPGSCHGEDRGSI